MFEGYCGEICFRWNFNVGWGVLEHPEIFKKLLQKINIETPNSAGETEEWTCIKWKKLY